jgi:parallel beta-helix repeat protein
MTVSRLRQWLSALIGSNPLSRPNRRHRARLDLEMLEGRCTPSTLTVPSSQYSTVQSAVNAAKSGDTILVEPGTYTGQIVITTSKITLTTPSRQPNATLAAPATLTGDAAIIDIIGAKHVVINDFNIVGNTSTQFGIFVNNGGSATITNNSISNILGSGGAGIVVGRALQNTTGSAIVIGNSVSSYTIAGIVIDNTGSTGTVTCNTVTGLGNAADTSTLMVAQEGIQVSFGANAEVLDNFVTNNTTTAAEVGADSVGILLYQPGTCTFVESNIVTGNNFGVFVYYCNQVQVGGNVVYNNANDGIQLFETSNSSIEFNISAYNGGDGISDYSGTNNLIVGNVIIGNSGNGVTLSGTSSDIVALNVIADNGGNGVSLDMTNGTAVAFNFIDNNDGTTSVQIACTDSSGNTIVRNITEGV